MIAALLFIAWALACCNWEGEEDYQLIRANKPVHHTVSEWFDRAMIVVLGGAGIIFGWILIEGYAVFNWHLLYWIPMGWAAWTSGFRWFLNSKRGLHWCYVSPSNLYDWLFLRLMSFQNRQHCIDDWHEFYFDSPANLESAWRILVHRAGLLEYITEQSILVVAMAFYLFT